VSIAIETVQKQNVNIWCTIILCTQIRKISGRRWIQSDKIWCIPNNKESFEILVDIFGKERVVLCDGQIKYYIENLISAAEKELKLKNIVRRPKRRT